jgi:hypothetical protein
MDYTDKKEHRIAVLNDVNDSETFIVITDNHISLGGTKGDLAACLASAIIVDPKVQGIITQAIKKVQKFKNENKTHMSE